jgi:hypothetical protein
MVKEEYRYSTGKCTAKEQKSDPTESDRFSNTNRLGSGLFNTEKIITGNKNSLGYLPVWRGNYW